MKPIRALPRGERLAEYVAIHVTEFWPEGRCWVALLQRNDNIPWWMRFDVTQQVYIWTAAESIRRWAAPVRRLRDERRALRAFGKKVEGIMGSICGAQTVNWSEHIYPLRAALTEAGFHGNSYEIDRKNVGTLIDNINRVEKENYALRARVRELEAEAAGLWAELKDAP